MSRLIWIDATEGDPARDPLWKFLAASVAELADGRCDTTLRHLPFGAGGIRNPATRLLSDASVLAAAIAAEPDADMLVLGCWGAPTTAVRTALNIPVSSLAEASAHAVSALAQRAAVVTVSPTLVPIFTADLASIGSHGFLAGRPVWAYAPESTHADVVDALADPTALIDRFDAVARRAVDVGADAIVVGCGYLAPIFAAHGYSHVSGHSDVAVLDCNRIAFEHAMQLHRLAAAGVTPAPRSFASPAGAAANQLARAVDTLIRGEGDIVTATA